MLPYQVRYRLMPHSGGDPYWVTFRNYERLCQAIRTYKSMRLIGLGLGTKKLKGTVISIQVAQGNETILRQDADDRAQGGER